MEQSRVEEQGYLVDLFSSCGLANLDCSAWNGRVMWSALLKSCGFTNLDGRSILLMVVVVQKVDSFLVTNLCGGVRKVMLENVYF